jgi:polyisoprenoid-binding protein YceI
MKRALVFLFLFVIGAGIVSAQSTKWVQDASHSNVGFSIKHMLVSTVRGNFKDYKITMLSDKEDFSDAKIEVVINTASINTENGDRDNHLRGDDFFNAEKYPTMTFKGKSMKKVGKDKYKLTGDLTIRDVTKQVTLDVEFGGKVKDPWGNTKTGFTIEGDINRFNYGLKWNKAVEAGGLVVSENVHIICEVELAKQ